VNNRRQDLDKLLLLALSRMTFKRNASIQDAERRRDVTQFLSVVNITRKSSIMPFIFQVLFPWYIQDNITTGMHMYKQKQTHLYHKTHVAYLSPGWLIVTSKQVARWYTRARAMSVTIHIHAASQPMGLCITPCYGLHRLTVTSIAWPRHVTATDAFNIDSPSTTHLLTKKIPQYVSSNHRASSPLLRSLWFVFDWLIDFNFMPWICPLYSVIYIYIYIYICIYI